MTKISNYFSCQHSQSCNQIISLIISIGGIVSCFYGLSIVIKPTIRATSPSLSMVINNDFGPFLDSESGADLIGSLGNGTNGLEEAKSSNGYNKPTQAVAEFNIVSTISIPKINLNQVQVAYSSLDTMNDLYAKMDNHPVLDMKYASDFCNKTAYLMGHSEPYYKGQKGIAVNIFSRLHELDLGDKIFVISANGERCVYQINSWDTVITNNNDEITEVDFNKLFNPVHTSNILTIQTCKKGSSTVRLILRATQINL